MPPIDGLWVSPMLRCRQTAEILFPGVEQRLVDALKMGTFEGKTWAELKDNPIYQAWLAGNPHIAFPGGEVLGEHIARCRRGVAHVVEQARALGMSRPGILAHGGTLMSAMSGFAVPHQDFYSWLPSRLRRIPSPGGGGEGAGLHPSGDAVSRLWVLLAAAALDWLLGDPRGCPTPYG